jgi:hypothetical protein
MSDGDIVDDAHQQRQAEDAGGWQIWLYKLHNSALQAPHIKSVMPIVASPL